MLNVVIIDDLDNQIELIEKHVLSLGIDDLCIHKYNDEEDFIKHIQDIPEFSLFLIDVVLKKHSGIELAKVINEYVRGAIVIFISNYLDKVVDIYDAKHYYFIYKPELEKRLPIAFNKAIESMNQMKEILPIVIKGKTIILHPHDITYLERQKHITFIRNDEDIIKCPDKLEDLQNKLPSYFIRCHRSYMVNAQKVIEKRRDLFILEDRTSIPISRAYQKKTEELFNQFLLNHL